MDIYGGLSDIAITSDGDFIVSSNELADVSGIDWFNLEVMKILKSGNDWSWAANAGASLDRFYGAMNTRVTANQITNLIQDKITQQNIQVPATLVVNVVPLDRDVIKIYINLDYNGQVTPVTALVFNLQQGTILDTDLTINQVTTGTPNKHPFSTKFL